VHIVRRVGERTPQGRDSCNASCTKGQFLFLQGIFSFINRLETKPVASAVAYNGYEWAGATATVPMSEVPNGKHGIVHFINGIDFRPCDWSCEWSKKSSTKVGHSWTVLWSARWHLGSTSRCHISLSSRLVASRKIARDVLEDMARTLSSSWSTNTKAADELGSHVDG
jgi:hypothetical protein